jgi:hypothetical protein
MYNDRMIMDGDLVNATRNTGADFLWRNCEITHVGELGESKKILRHDGRSARRRNSRPHTKEAY